MTIHWKAPPPLSTAILATFFVQTVASWSRYVSETNVVAKVTDSDPPASPKPNLWN
jgi:hypothetical protein